MTDEWDEFFRRETEKIAEAFSPYAWAMRHRELKAPPTRAEIIKATWAEVEPFWDQKAGPDGLLAVCEHSDIGVLDFTPHRYGDVIVIECEGVAVKRIPVTTVNIG